MFRRFALATAVTAVVPLGVLLAGGAANAATTASCSGVIAIQSASFDPPSVPAGQDSTLNVVVQNCTDQTVQGNGFWFGTFTGITGGCPVVDPVLQPYTIAPHGTFTLSALIGDQFPSCAATGFRATAEVDVNGNPGADMRTTADLVIVQPGQTGGVCHVTYTKSSEWQGGFTASVTIANTGTTPVNGWTLAFTFPGDQKITNSWNTALTQTGAGVSAANLSYNATIAPGGSQSFGFQATWSASDVSPTSFSVNGSACS
jgi:cellulase/cellobiase CelA1